MTRVTGNGTRATLLAVVLLGAATGGIAAQGTTLGTTRRVPSPAEQADTVRATLQRGSVLAQRISSMLEEARRENDIIRVTCLNDKLTQVNANMRTAQTRMAAYQNAVDQDQRAHEATVLTVLGQKFQVLDQEANRCVGQDLYDTGSTKVQTEIDTAMLPFEADPATPTAPPPSAVPDLPRYSSGTR